MHARKLLHRFLKTACSGMHLHRYSSLIACCEGLLLGQRLTVTDIGRSINNQVAAKHKIKRADRLLSNSVLYRESFSIYQLLARKIIRNTTRPVILVDWSDLTSVRSHFLLRAVLAVKGRPITLYEEVHTQLDNRKTHQSFLHKLKHILPESSKPIIVTDAGFRGTWITQVEALNWDWISRIRGNILCASTSSPAWFPCKELMVQATSSIKDFRRMKVIRNQNIHCRLCLVKRLSKRRHCNNIDGSRSARKHSKMHSASAKEAWLIATSLDRCSAKTVIHYYAQRMQIEESFRDTKNTRYGLSLRMSGTRCTHRLTILLLIGHIGTLMLYLMGIAAEEKRAHCKMQSNTVRTKRVLSPVYLGCLMVRCYLFNWICCRDIELATKSIAAVIAEYDF